jgi:hypothetical protein
MSSDNPLKKDHGEDSVKGDQFNNLNTIRRVQIQGQVHEISSKLSQPDPNGVYQDTETISIVTDPAGNPLPEDGRPYAISWSGQFIRSQEQMAVCNSRFHQPNLSRTILVGQDGRLTPNGAICSRCQAWWTNIYIGLGIICIGCFIGLLKAVGII